MATENWFSRRKGKNVSNLFKLDTRNKTPEENIIEILKGLYTKTLYQYDTSPTNRTVSSELKPSLLGRGVQKNSSDGRRVSYLNALVTLLCKENKNDLGFTTDELMTCIRISLVDESMVIRAAALRVLRYLIKTENDVATFNNLKLPYLVIRSIDLMLRNEEERAQALRVVRRVVAVVGGREVRGARVDPALLRCLAAVARAASAPDGTGDRLSRPAIATLAEICVLSPEMFMSCGGVSAVSRQLQECATPRMAEALCGVLLHALNHPTSRRAARIDLTCLTAPYCDFHVRPAGTESSRDEREMRFTCSRLALVCILRSWPGLLHFCHPQSSGGLKALIAALYLPRLEVRKAILDLLYELVGLPQPEWTDEISVALDAIDPADFQDAWRLNENFVVAEGISILPHLGATGPDITEIHLALLLRCFLEAGVLEGLAEVIVSSDTFICVRATVLLGQLVHLAHVLLPAPPALPSLGALGALGALAAHAARGHAHALNALAALRRLHAMLEARPAAHSLFLDHILQYCAGTYRHHATAEQPGCTPKPDTKLPERREFAAFEGSFDFFEESDTESEPKRHSVGSRADLANRNVSALVKSKSVSSRTMSKVTKSAKFFNLFERESDNLIRCTLVMQNTDGNTWNWEIIRTILKENESAPLLNLNDSGHKAWVTRIIQYLKPSSNKYSHTDLSSTCHGHSATRAGCQLIRHLLKHNDVDSQRMLEELFLDVSRQIKAIETGLKAHECLFSPYHMSTTMCQMYFLFIGQLCHSETGLILFKQSGLYANLIDLSTKTHHSCYVKLVISSLDYTLDSYPRDILAKTLTCHIQASRLYTTQFLNVLLRASRKSRELIRRKSKIRKNAQEYLKARQKNDYETDGVDMETWILYMLVSQVRDDSKIVVKVALAVLEEAFSVPSFVEKLMSMREILCHNCRLDKYVDPSFLDFSLVGDRGYLIWLSLEVAAIGRLSDAKSTEFLKKHMDFWTKSYNYRYVRLVEAGVHEALSLGGGEGHGWRAPRPARPPPHLHAALARLASHAPHASHAPQDPHDPNAAEATAAAQTNVARLILAPALAEHYKILHRKKCVTDQEIADIKASLWAVGNTTVTPQGLQMLMNLTNGYLEDSVLVHIIRLAKYNPVYSIRATAFYVLGLIGSTYEGANLLFELGWLCVRHTRHEQFPMIPDETYLAHDQNHHQYFIASPDYRYNAYDVDVSEHSDHTDQSVLESLQTDKLIKGEVVDQPDNDVVDHSAACIEDRRDSDKRKSHTLPTQSGSTCHERPMLSESRTVDILKDCSSYERSGSHRIPTAENRLLIGRMNSLENAHEGRVRNTSESSTSGVSSCDSFLGKYAIPDRVLTLSPIPSSSSLYGMKSINSSQRPKLPEMQRRISTSSFSGHDVTSSPPSQMDMTGYATLKSLNRRPHYSESAATSSEIEDLSWLLTETNRKQKPFASLRDRAKNTRERMTKLSLLEYDWKPLPWSEGRTAGVSGAAGAAGAGAAEAVGAAGRASAPDARPHPSPAYIGICLPRDLMDLFPGDEEIKNEDFDKIDHSKRGRLPSFLADISNASTDNKSRATPDSQKLTSKDNSLTRNARYMGSSLNVIPPSVSTGTLKKQDTTDSSSSENTSTDITVSGPVLNVSAGSEIDVNNVQANKTPKGILSSSKDEKNKINKEEAEADNAHNITHAVGNKDYIDNSINSAVDGESGIWRHVEADCLACVRKRPLSSFELREAFFAAMDNQNNCVQEPRSPDTPSPENTAPQAELLRQVHMMANPIHLRQTRSVLLSMKQKHPEVFRNPCVYSDVCALLGRDTYMLCARRFLQELFFDTWYECFAWEPSIIVGMHRPITPILD